MTGACQVPFMAETEPAPKLCFYVVLKAREDDAMRDAR
jgi:hypothetical protein